MSAREYVRVADTSELPPGEMKAVDVHGTAIAIGNVGGILHAFGNECTHDGGPLNEGDLEAGIVTCPWHFSRFCIRSGSVIASPAEEPIAVYDLKIEGTTVYVGVSGMYRRRREAL